MTTEKPNEIAVLGEHISHCLERVGEILRREMADASTASELRDIALVLERSSTKLTSLAARLTLPPAGGSEPLRATNGNGRGAAGAAEESARRAAMMSDCRRLLIECHKLLDRVRQLSERLSGGSGDQG